ncbi:MAG: Asp23/Gls24 family envelope stress response protein [Clostridia bacterium]
MSLTTSNKYGKISISDEAVQFVASHTASECYGVVELVSRRFSDNIGHLFNKQQLGLGISVATVDNLIYIEVFVILKVGVNIEAVKKSLSDAVKFALETFTGMRVKRVHVNVVGIRV